MTIAINLRTISSYIPKGLGILLRMTPIKNQAIQTALIGDWQNAVLLNQSILEENPEDIDTLNRLGFAYSSLGKLQEATEIYQKVLSLDNQNPIALRNLKRLNKTDSNTLSSSSPNQLNISSLFIEEPGKTKIIELINIADKKTLSPLRSGEQLIMAVKRMKIFVYDQNKQYLGMFPDDIGRRIIPFMEGGNKYDAYIKSVDHTHVSIFARETKRDPQFINQPSFQSVDKSKLQILSSKQRK